MMATKLTPLEIQLRDALEATIYSPVKVKLQDGLWKNHDGIICSECGGYDREHAPDCAVGPTLGAAKAKETGG